MNKFTAIIFAYMLSISSAFAAETVNKPEDIFANLIASDQGMKPQQVRIIITHGEKQLEAAKAAGIRVISLKVDTRSDNFMANVAAGYSNPFEVKGKYERIRAVPVMARNVSKGEVITAADITYLDVREKLLRRGYVTEAEALIGKQAERNITAKKPIMPTLIANRTVITKGSMITAIYKSDMMRLQDSMLAMEDGAVGEVIRIKNVNSNKVVRGKVTAANIVELTALRQLASN